jgi:hypothetical protein
MATPTRERPKLESRVPSYMAALEIAFAHGDLTAAGKAQQALASLGWDVRPCPSPTNTQHQQPSMDQVVAP